MTRAATMRSVMAAPMMKKHQCGEATMVKRRGDYGCEATMLEQWSGDKYDGDCGGNVVT